MSGHAIMGERRDTTDELPTRQTMVDDTPSGYYLHSFLHHKREGGSTVLWRVIYVEDGFELEKAT